VLGKRGSDEPAPPSGPEGGGKEPAAGAQESGGCEPAHAADASAPSKNEDKPKRKGHGRNGASSYTGAEKVTLPHSSVQHGQRCPHCDKGKVYEQLEPATLVRVTGMAPLSATVYECQLLPRPSEEARGIATSLQVNPHGPPTGAWVGAHMLEHLGLPDPARPDEQDALPIKELPEVFEVGTAAEQRCSGHGV
jgi:hypothetical protein